MIGAVTWIWTTVQTVVAAITAFWAENGEQIVAVATEIWTFVSAIVLAGVGFIRDIVTFIMTEVAAFWATNGAAIMETARAMWEIILLIITGTIDNIGKAIAVFVVAISVALLAIGTFWNAHSEEIMAVASAAWDFIKAIIETTILAIRGIVVGISKLIQGDWEGFGEEMEGQAAAMWEAVKKVFETAVNLLSTATASIIAVIKSAFTDTDWGAVGRGIIDGIASAITGGAGSIADAARRAAASAYDAAKDWLGINSPSTKFIEIGKNTIEGFVVGAKAMTSSAADMVAGIMGNLPSIAVDAVDAGQTAVNSSRGVAGTAIAPKQSSGFDMSALAAMLSSFAGETNNVNQLNVATTQSQGDVIDSFALLEMLKPI